MEKRKFFVPRDMEEAGHISVDWINFSYQRKYFGHSLFLYFGAKIDKKQYVSTGGRCL